MGLRERGLPDTVQRVAPPYLKNDMTDQIQKNIQNAETRISALLKLPPPHSSWSHQRTVEFKECCKLAISYMNRQRKKLERIIEIEQQLRSYF